MSKGLTLIANERRRQVAAEGFDARHDAQHVQGEIIRAAAAYCLSAAARTDRRHIDASWYIRTLHELWPWSAQWWKPKTPLEDLVRAGALIAAEIDRRLAAGEELPE